MARMAARMSRTGPAMDLRTASDHVGADTATPEPLASMAKTSRNAKRPKYFIIRDWLTDRILGGHFARGEQLPSEHELMEQFSVSRVTARQALNGLREFGLIESRRGKGYFVRQLTAVQQLGRLEGFGEMMAPLGVETKNDVIELLEIPATDKDLIKALQLRPGELVTRIARLRLAGGIAMSLDVSYFPVDIGRRLAILDLGRTDIFSLLEDRLNIELSYADLHIVVVPADEQQARLLGVAAGGPVIRICRLTRDVNGKPIDYEFLYSRIDMLQFKLRITRY
jgi:GntR family transcriptional regulator